MKIILGQFFFSYINYTGMEGVLFFVAFINFMLQFSPPLYPLVNWDVNYLIMLEH